MKNEMIICLALLGMATIINCSQEKQFIAKPSQAMIAGATARALAERAGLQGAPGYPCGDLRFFRPHFPDCDPGIDRPWPTPGKPIEPRSPRKPFEPWKPRTPEIGPRKPRIGDIRPDENPFKREFPGYTPVSANEQSKKRAAQPCQKQPNAKRPRTVAPASRP